MDKTFRDILDLICGNTAFVMTIFFVVAVLFAWTLLCGPSWDLPLCLLSLGVCTAVVEFWSEASARA